jgi:hypothetical protein
MVSSYYKIYRRPDVCNKKIIPLEHYMVRLSESNFLSCALYVSESNFLGYRWKLVRFINNSVIHSMILLDNSRDVVGNGEIRNFTYIGLLSRVL